MSNRYECIECEHQIARQIMPLYCDGCGRPGTYALTGDPERQTRAISALDVEAVEPERFPTGDLPLDATLQGGFVRPSTLTAYGKPGAGKSRCCIRWACHMGRTLLISLEMAPKLAVFSAKSARTKLSNLYVTDSEDNWEAEAERLRVKTVVFDSFNYSQRPKLEILTELSEWTKAADGLALVIAHQNAKGRLSGTTLAEHWPDYLFKFTKQEQGLSKVAILKGRYTPGASAIVEI